MFNVTVNGYTICGVIADNADAALLIAIRLLGLDMGFNIDAFTYRV